MTIFATAGALVVYKIRKILHTKYKKNCTLKDDFRQQDERSHGQIIED